MRLIHGDSLLVLPTLPENSVDAVVTDPPYDLTAGKKGGSGLASENLDSPAGRSRITTGFMGKAWDGTGIAFRVELWAAVLRVMKPGAHLLAFGGTRTHHRMVCAIEDAGFEIRDELDWVYGQGFPKSLNLGNGYGTGLKPSKEPICLARKPVEGTITANFAKWGCGGLNIDGCRVVTDEVREKTSVRAVSQGGIGTFEERGGGARSTGSGANHQLGRWPANLLHDGSDDVRACFPSAPGQIATSVNDGSEQGNSVYGKLKHGGPVLVPREESDKSAARFFYQAKSSPSDREEDCGHLPVHSAAEMVDREPGSDGMNSPRAGAGRTSGRRNHHPTVKPTDLMRYLCRLVTPPAGTVLDPFMGSGSTGKAARLEGFNFIGIEREAEFLPVARARAYGDLIG